MERSAHATPLVVSPGSVSALKRIQLGSADDKSGWREAFIQELVYNHPEVIPMESIEPALRPLLSVCRELPLAGGSLDNVWITPDAWLVLGECKLVRNAQSRREVVAQALDYARSIMALSYEELENALRRSGHRKAERFWDVVKEEAARDEHSLNEHQFVDTMQRRVRRGQFLILIIGDGIQEGAESLTEFLQMHAGVGATMAMVDLSIWSRGQTDPVEYLVVPRIPMRTTLIKRGVVTIMDDRIAVSQSQQSSDESLSEVDFFATLAAKRPDLVKPLETLVSDVEQLNITPEIGKTIVLRWYPKGSKASAGTIDSAGGLVCLDAAYYAAKLGKPDAGRDYLATVARLSGGKVIRADQNNPEVTTQDGRRLNIASLLPHQADWFEALSRFWQALEEE